jgi:hypothetical protein
MITLSKARSITCVDPEYGYRLFFLSPVCVLDCHLGFADEMLAWMWGVTEEPTQFRLILRGQFSGDLIARNTGDEFRYL